MMDTAIRQTARAVQDALTLIYPKRCFLCEEPTAENFSLCATCWSQTEFLGGLTCRTCGASLPGEGDGTEVCDDCLSLARPWSRGYAAIRYDGAGRRFALKLKHGDRPDLARVAADWMTQRVGVSLLRDALIVPIPIHWSRRILRRYNQSAEIARRIAHLTGADVDLMALKRVRATPSQDHRSVTDRFANLDGAITATTRHRMTARHVMLVDDVMTSGATLASATRAAREAGASDVSVVVLARVVKQP